MNHKTDESFGIIPLVFKNNQWEVFLVQHRHGRYWGFPKGHKEAGESGQNAAERELKEETNLDVVRFISDEPLTEQYRFFLEKKHIFKTVYYYMAEVSGTVVLEHREISGGMWLLLSEALLRLTHPEGKSIMLQVEKFLAQR